MTTVNPAVLSDLPVAVCLPDPLGTQVQAWVEGELGWQVVPPEGPPRPVVTLRGIGDARAGSVVIADGEVDNATLRLALEAGVRDVLGWPGDRERLTEIVRRPAAVSEGGGPPVWSVAGAGGGVGTSTVALAVAGLAAWSGRSVIVVGSDDLLELCGAGEWTGPGLAEIRALGPVDGSAEVTALASPIPGVDGLAVLSGNTDEPFDVCGWPVDLVVVDCGAVSGAGRLHDGVDLLVTAPDSRAERARLTAAPLLVVGDGPLGKATVRALSGRRAVGWLPSSARVANAAIQGRVPAGLPGTWLRALKGALVGAKR